jgi:hypothetical protein
MNLRSHNLLALIAGLCVFYLAAADEGKHIVSYRITDLVSFAFQFGGLFSLIRLLK